MDCNPSGSSVHGIFQSRILEWVALSYSRGSSPPSDWTHIHMYPSSAGTFFTTVPPGNPNYLLSHETSLVAQTVKHLPTMWETWVQTRGWEDLLEKEMVTHSSILAWKIPWMEEPGTVHGVTKSWTRPSDFTFFLSFYRLVRAIIGNNICTELQCLAFGKPSINIYPNT